MADSFAPTEIISLPKGGGALKGLGEKFSPDLHTGTGNFTIPIAVPRGRNGLQPDLTLVYSTGHGNGPFGLGWQLGIPGVARQTSKGVPMYRGADVFVLSDVEDLVPVEQIDATTMRYRPRTEGLFARIVHYRDEAGAGDYWEVRGKEGIVSRYGTPRPDVPDWRDPAVAQDPNPLAARNIFAWRITETRDPFGNVVRYEYGERDAGDDGVHVWDQPLLGRIRYVDFGDRDDPQFLVSVAFEYEDRPSDPFSDYRAGFEIRTTRRCRQITVRTHAEPEHLVRTYRFEYDSDAHTGGSRLIRLRVIGYEDDGTAREELPALEFDYSAFAPEARRFLTVTGDDLPPFSLSHPDVELVDLFGNGLPDIVELGETARYWRNLGDARFDRPRLLHETPARARLADVGVQFVDANGDGRADLLVTAGPISGYYSVAHQGRGIWDRQPFRTSAAAPSFSLEDPDVRLVDLDGDGVTDAIRSSARLECFFNNPSRGWDARTASRQRGPLEQFPNVDFQDERVRWADMVGDRLQDVVLLYDGNVEYWPSLGQGRWGARVHMENSPRFPYGYNPRQILLGDVDGDGLADIVYVGNREVTLWINQSGNRWSDPITIHGTPPLTDATTIRLVDLLGCGVDGLLWSDDAAPGGRPRAYFLDFTGGVKPYLLTGIDNQMGAVTTIEYAPSTRFYLRDQQHWRTRWTTPLPFPVQVVAHVEVVDALSQGRLTTEYRYRHGYWDGVERQFHGFGMVEALDRESFVRDQPGVATTDAHFSPPLLTRTWFHPGPVGEEFGNWEEPDRSHEYWQGDPPRLRHRDGVDAFLAALPTRRTRRDALRTLRGSVLRTELYALDETPRSDRPFTVTEYAYDLREESRPAADAGDRARIFFPHQIAQRVTQWERGSDPLTQFTFTSDYDPYGQPRSRTQIAVPRGRQFDIAIAPDDLAPEPYLATHALTRYAQRDDAARYIVDRVARTRIYEIANDGRDDVLTLAEDIASSARDVPDRLFSETVSFFDGPAFTGLPYRQVGDYGALVRIETLAFTRSMLEDAYRSGSQPLVPAEVPAYLDAGGAVAWPAEYPLAFRTWLRASAGYTFRPAATPEFSSGYFVTSDRRRYDFHDDANGLGRGLIVNRRDPLDADTLIAYDSPYELLPTAVRQITDRTLPVKENVLVTTASHNYRVLQPAQVTDPNDNTIEFTFSPLGLTTETWVRGKGDPQNPEGDLQQPSTMLAYDFRAFLDRQEPIVVRTVTRAHHDSENDIPQPQRDQTIEKREYSDGFGRLLQTRVQGEDVRFGDSTLGGGQSVLAAEQTAPGAGPVTGVRNSSATAPNVVVSGWQAYDAKGRVVERYEPFFSTGWQYAPASESVLTASQKTTTFYDARGRASRTLNADGSEQLIVYGIPADLARPDDFTPTPWIAYLYDANDNAGRTHATTSTEYRHHWNTPTSFAIDALERRVETVQRTRPAPAAPLDPLPPIEEYRTTTRYDIRGNIKTIVDPLGRVALALAHDLANRVWRTESLDRGVRRSVLDASGTVIELRDGKGALALQSYDALRRPNRLWARNTQTAAPTLREIRIYGDAPQSGLTAAEARALNLLGRLYQHYDEAGLLTNAARGADGVPTRAFDCKGNLLETHRTVIADSAIDAGGEVVAGAAAAYVVDWEVAPALEGDYQTSMTYDALNRAKSTRCPRGADGLRRMLVPSYNRAGGLERVTLDGATYVERVAYNAKGQRTLVAYGNRVMTRYAYDPASFRLVRLRSERYAKSAETTYDPDSNAVQDYAYVYDLAGNIVRVTERTDGCGVRNNPQALFHPGLEVVLTAGDALVRRFSYDPLYRLTFASGREGTSVDTPRAWQDVSQNGFNWSGAPNRTPLNAKDATQIYSETYEYDPSGNILRLAHSSGWSRYFGYGGLTPQQWRASVDTFLAGGGAVGGSGNQLSSMGNAVDQATTHVYDAAGNMTREYTNRWLMWDHSDRMIGFTDRPAGAAPTLEQFCLYDGDGNRVKKRVRTGGGTSTAVFIGDLFEHHSWRDTGDPNLRQTTLVHVMDDAGRIALARVGDVHDGDGGPPVQYHLADHLESSTIVIGGAAATSDEFINREEYFAYGETSFGSFGRKRYRFIGKECDESGLRYHQARYYAPSLCRWVSPDPAGSVDGSNTYLYCRDNPLRYTDASGLQEEELRAATEAIQGLANLLTTGAVSHAVTQASQEAALAEAQGASIWGQFNQGVPYNHLANVQNSANAIGNSMSAVRESVANLSRLDSPAAKELERASANLMQQAGNYRQTMEETVERAAELRNSGYGERLVDVRITVGDRALTMQDRLVGSGRQLIPDAIRDTPRWRDYLNRVREMPRTLAQVGGAVSVGLRLYWMQLRTFAASTGTALRAYGAVVADALGTAVRFIAGFLGRVVLPIFVIPPGLLKLGPPREGDLTSTTA